MIELYHRSNVIVDKIDLDKGRVGKERFWKRILFK